MIYIIETHHGDHDGYRKGILVRTISGRSATEGIPVDAEELRIRRQGQSIILDPVLKDWAWLDRLEGKLDQDFIDAVNEEPARQERPELDKFFR